MATAPLSRPSSASRTRKSTTTVTAPESASQPAKQTTAPQEVAAAPPAPQSRLSSASRTRKSAATSTAPVSQPVKQSNASANAPSTPPTPQTQSAPNAPARTAQAHATPAVVPPQIVPPTPTVVAPAPTPAPQPNASAATPSVLQVVAAPSTRASTGTTSRSTRLAAAAPLSGLQSTSTAMPQAPAPSSSRVVGTKRAAPRDRHPGTTAASRGADKIAYAVGPLAAFAAKLRDLLASSSTLGSWKLMRPINELYDVVRPPCSRPCLGPLACSRCARLSCCAIENALPVRLQALGAHELPHGAPAQQEPIRSKGCSRSGRPPHVRPRRRCAYCASSLSPLHSASSLLTIAADRVSPTVVGDHDEEAKDNRSAANDCATNERCECPRSHQEQHAVDVASRCESDSSSQCTSASASTSANSQCSTTSASARLEPVVCSRNEDPIHCAINYCADASVTATSDSSASRTYRHANKDECDATASRAHRPRALAHQHDPLSRRGWSHCDTRSCVCVVRAFESGARQQPKHGLALVCERAGRRRVNDDCGVGVEPLST